jgi:uncharacterized membrane protein YkoI
MRKYLAMACLFLAVSTTAMADDDHERARTALERGEILPLLTILERLAPVIDGDIVETELERDEGRWVYEIAYIDGSGRLIEIEIDAADATILKEKRKR